MSQTTQKNLKKTTNTMAKRNFECIMTKKEVISYDKFQQRRFHDLTEQQRTKLINYWNKRLSHLEKDYWCCIISNKSKDYNSLILMNKDFYHVFNDLLYYLILYLTMNKYSNDIKNGIISFWNTDVYRNTFSTYYTRYNKLWYIIDFPDKKYNIESELKNIESLKSKIKKICTLNDFIYVFKNSNYTISSEEKFYENIEKHEHMKEIIDAQFSSPIIFKDLNQFDSLNYIIYKILKQNDYTINHRNTDNLFSSYVGYLFRDKL